MTSNTYPGTYRPLTTEGTPVPTGVTVPPEPMLQSPPPAQESGTQESGTQESGTQAPATNGAPRPAVRPQRRRIWNQRQIAELTAAFAGALARASAQGQDDEAARQTAVNAARAFGATKGIPPQEVQEKLLDLRLVSVPRTSLTPRVAPQDELVINAFIARLRGIADGHDTQPGDSARAGAAVRYLLRTAADFKGELVARQRMAMGAPPIAGTPPPRDTAPATDGTTSATR